jgi:hypothetical protein
LPPESFSVAGEGGRDWAGRGRTAARYWLAGAVDQVEARDPIRND